MRNINDDIKVTKDLAEEYKLGRKGWKTVPNVPKFMVLSIKLQRLSLVQSKKKRSYFNNIYTNFFEKLDKKFIVEPKHKPNKYKTVVYAPQQTFILMKKYSRPLDQVKYI